MLLELGDDEGEHVFRVRVAPLRGDSARFPQPARPPAASVTSCRVDVLDPATAALVLGKGYDGARSVLDIPAIGRPELSPDAAQQPSLKGPVVHPAGAQDDGPLTCGATSKLPPLGTI